MAPAPSCLEGKGCKLLKRLVSSQRESVSSISASLEEVLEKSVVETFGGKGIFGEEGRMTPGTSLEQGKRLLLLPQDLSGCRE